MKQSIINRINRLSQFHVAGRCVFLRADLNVPLEPKTGKILNDHRLQAIIPTINYLHSQGAKIILATHIGRPQRYTPSLSTKHLIPWFEHHGFKLEFAHELAQAKKYCAQPSENIILLENLRFFKGEQPPYEEFAHQLASLADFYVNDAFGVMHRTDSSVTLVPSLLSSSKKSIGLLVQQELTALNRILYNPARPFVLIIGGAKITDKVPLILHLLDHIDTLVLCPAIVFTFLKALGKPVGNSLVENAMIPWCKTIVDKAAQKNKTIIFPHDYLVTEHAMQGKLHLVNADQLNNYFGISIGPVTSDMLKPIIHQAKTIVYNGLMGDLHHEETLQGVNAIFQAMATGDGFSLIAGGDSAAAAYQLGYADKIDFISTGGGATLAYLTGESLPGLNALE